MWGRPWEGWRTLNISGQRHLRAYNPGISHMFPSYSSSPSRTGGVTYQSLTPSPLPQVLAGQEQIQKPKGGHCTSFIQRGHKSLTVQGFPLDRAVQRALDLHTSNCLSQPAGDGGLGKPWSTYRQLQAETTHRPGWTWQKCARVCAHRDFGNIRQVCYPLSTDPPREWEPREKEVPTLPGQCRDAAPGCDYEPDLSDAGLPPNRTQAAFPGTGQRGAESKGVKGSSQGDMGREK